MGKAILAAAAFVLAACAVVDFSDLSVGIEPRQGGDPATVAVAVAFSREPVHSEAEALFSLSSGSQALGGDFAWTGSTMLFTPVPALRDGQKYYAKVSGTLHTLDGLSFPAYAARAFVVGVESDAARLVDCSVADGATIGRTDALVFRFSRPMNKTAWIDGLAITPQTDTNKTWSADATTLTVAPKTGWTNLADYHWEVQTSFVDAAGKPLLEAVRKGFMAAADNEPPRLLAWAIGRAVQGPGGMDYVASSADLDAMQKGDALMLVFSERVDMASLGAAFRLNPSLRGQFFEQPVAGGWQYAYAPSEDPQAGAAYVATVSTAVADLAGNAMVGAQTKRFTPRLPYLSIAAAVLANTADSSATVAVNAPGAQASIAPAAPDYRLSVSFDVDFGLALAGFADADKAPFLDQAECLHVFPNSATVKDPALVSIAFIGGKRIVFTYTGFSVSADPAARHYFKFRLPGGVGGVHTASGQYFAEDQWFTFCTE